MVLLLCLLIGFSVLYVAILLAELTPLRRRLRPAAWARLRWSAALGSSLPFLLLIASGVGLNPFPPPSAEGRPVEASLGFPLLPAKEAPPSFPKIDPGNEPDVYWLVHQYSNLHGVDPLLVLAVIQEESQFDARAASFKGAMGLMQITKETAEHLGLRDPFDIHENIEGGVRYLQILLERHSWDLRLALASYNAGPTKVERYGGIPPYPETHRYIRRVTARYKNLQRMAEAFRHWRPAPPASPLLAFATPGEEEPKAGARPAAIPASSSRGGGF
ncbi:MAG: lytic transglycosylase domain-containing protein [Candidatus Tectomicrobia bacterium]|nr:lytic transglycosylase domain-containing protein [Candidatus Tectomicrobia bacterium]MBI2177707.1 lytic transglycosylase domain-containing protein [Candidatus Tectomicrobia bacterium]